MASILAAARIRALTRIARPIPTALRRPMSVSTHPSLSAVATPNAPAAIGPYSQAVKAGNLVFISGCIPLDPTSMTIVEGGVETQTTQVFKNLTAVVQASGLNWERSSILGAQVFIKDMNDFGKINALYEAAFGAHKPARSCVEVSRLPKDVLVEIEAIATLS
ncbi:translation initiation inhibitor [Mucidula mucida]|nr:translation initiation inhibitor [Mucidula mucida]